MTQVWSLSAELHAWAIAFRQEAKAGYNPTGGLLWVAPKTWYTHNMAHTERRITVGDRGRLVLPSAVRRELDLKPGTHMLLSTDDDGSLRLRPYRAVAEQSRGLLRRLLPGGSMVDELLAERRAEADREDTE